MFPSPGGPKKIVILIYGAGSRWPFVVQCLQSQHKCYPRETYSASPTSQGIVINTHEICRGTDALLGKATSGKDTFGTSAKGRFGRRGTSDFDAICCSMSGLPEAKVMFWLTC